jgi:competence protein ComEA
MIWFWTPLIIALVALTIVGTMLAISRYARASEIEISIMQDVGTDRLIYITGNVSMTGWYPFTPDDTISDLLAAAGNPGGNGDLELTLIITPEDTRHETQRIDINRAEVWLLEALPGIGKTLAQRIVDYRAQKGPFRNTTELAKVAGIGNDTLDSIKNLITVSDR